MISVPVEVSLRDGPGLRLLGEVLAPTVLIVCARCSSHGSSAIGVAGALPA